MMKVRRALLQEWEALAFWEGRKTEMRVPLYEASRERTVLSKLHAGDLIWCAEAHFNLVGKDPTYSTVLYRADYRGGFPTSIPAHMKNRQHQTIPREPEDMTKGSSRLTLEVKSVHRQRVFEITDAEAAAEGASSKDEFLALWASGRGAGAPTSDAVVLHVTVHREPVHQVQKRVEAA